MVTGPPSEFTTDDHRLNGECGEHRVVTDCVNELLSYMFVFPCPTHRLAHEELDFFVSERDRLFVIECLELSASLQSRNLGSLLVSSAWSFEPSSPLIDSEPAFFDHYN